MKLGVSSYSFEKHMQKTGANYFDICLAAKNIGFDAIEFIDLKLDRGNGQQNIASLAADIKTCCDKLNLNICAYTVGADFLSGSDGDTQKEVERLKSCIDIAHILGAPLMRHDIVWSYTNQAKTYQDIIRLTAPSIREVADYAKSKGIKTCTENHGYIMQDSNRVEALILAVNHENFGWLIDIGNFACADESSSYALGIAAPYAFHVHAKDFLIKSGNQPSPGSSFFESRGGNYLRGTIVGHGEIPVSQCLRILQKSGYDNIISLEFEGLEEPIAAITEGFTYLKQLIN